MREAADLLNVQAKRIQRLWRKRMKSGMTATFSALSSEGNGSAAAHSRVPTKEAPRILVRTVSRPEDASEADAATLIQRLWKKRRSSASSTNSGGNRPCSDDVWVQIPGRWHTGDDLPNSGQRASEYLAKVLADRMPECIAFSLDRAHVPPMAWFHSRVSPSECRPTSPGRTRDEGQRMCLFVHSRRFLAMHNILPGELPATSAGSSLLRVPPASTPGQRLAASPPSRSPLSDWASASARVFSSDGESSISEALNLAAKRIQSSWRQKGKGSSIDLGQLEEPLLRDGPAGAQTAPASEGTWAFFSRSQVVAPSSASAPALPTGSGKQEPEKGAATKSAFWSDPSGWMMVEARRILGVREGKGIMEHLWEDQKHKALEVMHNYTAPALKQLLGSVGDYLKASVTSDPDMWPCVRPHMLSIVTSFWEDIEQEIETGLKTAVIAPPMTKSVESLTAPDDAMEELGWFSRHGLRIRSFLLHHYLPYNRSIFGKLKDKVYVCMVLTTMLPIFGIRVFFFFCILLMLLKPGPPDEFQLINFILTFKGTQFFTSGVGLGFFGAMSYYVCYLFAGDGLRLCIDRRGPGSTDWLSSLLFDYVGSMCLVWVAFLYLPRSRRKHWLHAQKVKRKEPEVYCCCLRGIVEQGGRLRKLLIYDLICFVTSFAFFIPVYLGAGNSILEEAEEEQFRFAHLKETVYWCRILYSLLSLPFVVFVIPGVGKVLTHSVSTGYDPNGRIMEFAYDEPALPCTHRKAG